MNRARRRYCGKPSLRQPRRWGPPRRLRSCVSWSSRWSWTRTITKWLTVNRYRLIARDSMLCISCSARSHAYEAPVDVRLRWAFLFHTLSLASAKAKVKGSWFVLWIWEYLGVKNCFWKKGWPRWGEVLAVRQAVGGHEPRRRWCRCGRIFFKFTRKQVRREKVPLGWTPSTEWHCVSLVLICAAESDSTLYGLLATYRRSVGRQHRGSTMTCWCFITSVPGCRRQLAPFLALISENATRWSLKLE